jgi:hypothetical protein
MSKLPKDMHRMKRPQFKDAKPGRRIQDIKKVYTKEQLAEIGAITLKWNDIDFFVDWSLLIGLSQKAPHDAAEPVFGVQRPFYKAS